MFALRKVLAFKENACVDRNVCINEDVCMDGTNLN